MKMQSDYFRLENSNLIAALSVWIGNVGVADFETKSDSFPNSMTRKKPMSMVGQFFQIDSVRQLIARILAFVQILVR